MTDEGLRGYILAAATFLVVGICTLEIYRDTYTPRACFLLSRAQPHICIMVGRAGQPRGWPDGRPVVQTLHVSPPDDLHLMVVMKIHLPEGVTMTTQLISVFNGKISDEPLLLCNARDLHEFLSVRKDFSTWIRERISDYGFAVNVDYIEFSPSSGKTGGRRRKDYHLTLDTAKELAMVERNDKGRQIRRYFIECEKRLRENHCHSISSTNYDSRTLCYKRAGIIINEMQLNDSDLVISLESWLQLAQKNGWVIIRREELANKITDMIENCLFVN